MKRTIIILVILIFTLNFHGCEEKTQVQLPGFYNPLIKGFIWKNHYGDYAGITGNPNIKTDIECSGAMPSSEGKYGFIAYPNPYRNNLIVKFSTPQDSIEKQIWIVRGKVDENLIESSNELNMNNIVISAHPIIEKTINSKNIRLNLSSLKKGYYRIYVKIDEYLFYDNIMAKTN